MKIDDSGNVLWANAYGSQIEERAYKICRSFDGGYLICGVANNPGYAYDQVIMKVDKSGKLIWSKVLGNENYDLANDIIELPDHSVYVTGGTDTTNGYSTYRGTMLKFDESGNLLWSKAWRSSNRALRNILYDKINNKFDIQGFWYTSPPPGIQEIYLMRTDTSGNPQFLKTFGPTAIGGYSVGGGNSLAPIAHGGMILLGVEQTFGFGLRDVYFIKMDSLANTNLCRVVNQSFSSSNFVLADHSYPFATTSFKPSVGNGITIFSPAIKDSLICPPFVANFYYTIPCKGYAIQFHDNSYSGATSWHWNFGDGSSGNNSSTLKNPTHTYPGNGTYTVTLISSNGIEKDTISQKITISPFSNYSITSDTPICAGSGIYLKAPTSGTSYLWNINGTDSTKAVILQFPTKTTIYTVRVGNSNGCFVIDTIKVDINPGLKRKLPADTFLCQGDTLQLNAYQPGVSYLWKDGSKNPLFPVHQAGLYSVTYRNGNCTLKDSVQVSQIVAPKIALGNDTTICQGDTFSYHLNGIEPGTIIRWQDYSTKAIYQIGGPGKYFVTLKNACGATVDSVNIKSMVCECDFFVPNVFTPNQDSINDIFIPIGCPYNLREYQFIVYNRWGELIFKTNDRLKGWDGKFRGERCIDGVYLYILSFKASFSHDNLLKGTITLLR